MAAIIIFLSIIGFFALVSIAYSITEKVLTRLSNRAGKYIEVPPFRD